MGEGLNKPLFSQRCLQTFFIFLSRAPRSPSLSFARFARALADVSEKNENKNITTAVFRLHWPLSHWYSVDAKPNTGFKIISCASTPESLILVFDLDNNNKLHFLCNNFFSGIGIFMTHRCTPESFTTGADNWDLKKRCCKFPVRLEWTL